MRRTARSSGTTGGRNGLSGRPGTGPARQAGLLLTVLLLAALTVTGQLSAQTVSASKLSPEQLVYPLTSVCLLDVRGGPFDEPFHLPDFYNDLVSYLRGPNYMTVRTEGEIREILQRNRSEIPEVYETAPLARIAQLSKCDFTAYLRFVNSKQDRMDGFSIPFLFHHNKVTDWVELDLALVEAKTEAMIFSKRIRGEASVGRKIQIYPVVEEPDLFLNFRDNDILARNAMRALARDTYEAILEGIHKPMGTKYICYWHNVVHIISDKPGLCPICGSRLVKIKR